MGGLLGTVRIATSAADAGVGAAVCGGGGDYDLVCPSAEKGYHKVALVPETDFIVRTPAQTVPACLDQCPSETGPKMTAAMLFNVGDWQYGTVEVSEPWHIGIADVNTLPSELTTCVRSASPDGCAPVFAGAIVVIWTDVPNPPARNVLIRNRRICRGPPTADSG